MYHYRVRLMSFHYALTFILTSEYAEADVFIFEHFIFLLLFVTVLITTYVTSAVFIELITLTTVFSSLPSLIYFGRLALMSV